MLTWLTAILYNLALEKKKVMAIQAKAMAQCYNVVIYCTIYTKREDNKTFITGKTKYMYTYIENQEI